MAKYLITGSYTADGVKRLFEDGAQSRVESSVNLAAALGGTVETFYYAFGTDDFVLIVDAPGNVSVAAASLHANATGISHPRVVVLMTAEEMDAAVELAKGGALPPLWWGTQN